MYWKRASHRWGLFLGLWTLPLFGAEEEGIIDLDPFEVSGYQMGLESEIQAADVEIISGNSISESGHADIVTVLERMGGLDVRSFSGNPGSGSVSMRGFGENSGLRSLVLVDGIPLNPPDMGGISWMEIPLGDVAQIEILRGSQTARYGSQAVGGVINILTRTGLGTIEGAETNLQLRLGSYQERLVRASTAHGKNNYQFSVGAEHYESDGYRENGGIESRNFSISGGIHLTERWRTRIRLYGTDERMQYPGPLDTRRYEEDPRQSVYTEFGLEDFYFSEGEKIGLTLGSEIALKDAGQFRFRGSLFSRDQKWNLGAGAHADNNLMSSEGTLDYEYRSGIWEFGSSIGTRAEELDVDLFFDIDRTLAGDSSSLERKAHYILIHGSRKMDRIRLEIALRQEISDLEGSQVTSSGSINFNESREDDGWAAQTGIKYTLSERSHVWVRVDRLYRFPVTDEIANYQGYTLGSQSDGFNLSLQPEEGYNCEAGLLFGGDKSELQLTVFLQRIEGEISYDFEAFQNVNLGKSERFGIEGVLSRRGDRWEIVTRFTALEATYRDGKYSGNDLYLVPNFRIVTDLSIDLSSSLLFNLQHSYRGRSFEGNDFNNERRTLPGVTLFHCSLRWAISDNFSLVANVQNVFDRRYTTLRFSGGTYPGTGRNTSLSANWRF